MLCQAEHGLDIYREKLILRDGKKWWNTEKNNGRLDWMSSLAGHSCSGHSFSKCVFFMYNFALSLQFAVAGGTPSMLWCCSNHPQRVMKAHTSFLNIVLKPLLEKQHICMPYQFSVRVTTSSRAATIRTNTSRHARTRQTIRTTSAFLTWRRVCDRPHHLHNARLRCDGAQQRCYSGRWDAETDVGLKRLWTPLARCWGRPLSGHHLLVPSVLQETFICVETIQLK